MNITILGCGKSGTAAAKLAVSKGYRVRLTESKDPDKFPDEYNLLKELGVSCEFGINSNKYLEHCDLLVTSPGVPAESKFLHEARKRNIEIISEIEFAYRHSTGKIVAITGTNGKTTTTTLIDYIFRNAGKKSIACGNIGLPFSEAVLNDSADTIYVVEVSSYQLDRINSFRPDVAIILNITPDHLAYHKTMQNYVDTKWKISSFQNEKNLLVLNNDDSTIFKTDLKTVAKIAHISLNPVDWGIYTKGSEIVFKTADKEEILMLTQEVGIPGVHNLYNSMAAALSARAFEINNEDIRDSLMSFKGVEHRLEFVRDLNGLVFINDSKATNINATWFALSSYKQPIIWLAGGRGDSNDYSVLDNLVEKNVKAIITYGEESDNIFNHFCTKVRCIKVDDLYNAVNLSLEIGEEEDRVLLSPACKSFDMFMNFEHRGEVFKQIVNSL